MMTKSIAAALLAVVSGLSVAGTAQAGPACMATCNQQNTDCTKAGKDQNICLGAWHQCKTSCSTPPRMTVARTGPNSITVKATPAPPPPTKH